MRVSHLRNQDRKGVRVRRKKLSDSQKIDREYIEGETPEEIGEIGRKKRPLDKAQRRASKRARS